MRLLLLALLVILVRLGPAEACSQSSGTVTYVIRDETKDEVGRLVMTFACGGDDLIVETQMEGEVKFLMMPFKRSARYHEVWRGERLIAFDSYVLEQNEIYEVKARAEGEHTVIEGRRGRIEAPANVVPNLPWNFAVLERSLLFNVQRGKLQHVRVISAGEETIIAGGRAVRAQKYSVTGDLERELWYDRRGNWLQWRFVFEKKVITLTRQ